jgi:hypothetical protein
MNQFFTTKYLFEINRVMLERSDKAFLVIGIALFVFAILFKLAAKLSPSPTDAKYRNKLFTLFLSIGLAEIIWFGARYELIRFFGSHFVALLILLIGFIWFVMLIVKAIKNYKSEKQTWEKEQVKMKYLPK